MLSAVLRDISKLALMSDSMLRVVPVEPSHCPPPEAVSAAERVLRSLFPGAEAVVASCGEQIAFVDAGENWEGVECPSCGADAEPWWNDAMSEAAESEFESLVVHAGCCGAAVSLNDLHYKWPVAFARCKLEVLNPGAPSLSSQQLSQVQAALGCQVRVVRARV